MFLEPAVFHDPDAVKDVYCTVIVSDRRGAGIGFKMVLKTSIFAPKHIKYSSSPLVKGIASTETAVMSLSFTARTEPGTEIPAAAKGLNIMARNGRSVWTLLLLTTDLIRNLCKAENIHIYSDNGNTLLVSEP